jgi:hypothetical protein
VDDETREQVVNISFIKWLTHCGMPLDEFWGMVDFLVDADRRNRDPRLHITMIGLAGLANRN